MTPDDMRELNKTIDRARINDVSVYPRNDGVPYLNSPKNFDSGHMTRSAPSQTLNTIGGYQEYTVKTPGIGNRAGRRVVINREAKTAYYSHDHYHSFIDISKWVFK